MKVYIFMILWTALVGFMAKGTEVNELVDGRLEKRSKYTYPVLIFGVIILFTGLRSSVGDTFTYMKNFKNLDVSGQSLSRYIRSSKAYQLFAAYGYIVKKYVSENPTVYLFGIALISGVCTMIGYRRCSPDFAFSVLLFLLAGKFTWMMNGIKQFLAVSLLFMCMKYITDKKRCKYLAVILAAYFIHPSAIIALPAYFICRGKPWSKRILLTLVLSLLAITFVGEFTDFLDFITEDTVFESDISLLEKDSGSSIMRFFIAAVPPLLAFIRRKDVEKIASPLVNVMVNMSVLTACSYLIATFTSGIVMGRIPIYFELSGFALLPWLLEYVYNEKDRKVLRVLCVAFYAVYFYVQVWGLEYTSETLNIYLY